MQHYFAKISKKVYFWLRLVYVKFYKIVVSLTIVYETTCETNVNILAVKVEYKVNFNDNNADPIS
jgi:hypothetical protein